MYLLWCFTATSVGQMWSVQVLRLCKQFCILKKLQATDTRGLQVYVKRHGDRHSPAPRAWHTWTLKSHMSRCCWRIWCHLMVCVGFVLASYEITKHFLHLFLQLFRGNNNSWVHHLPGWEMWNWLGENVGLSSEQVCQTELLKCCLL